jgi:hypothetical protein
MHTERTMPHLENQTAKKMSYAETPQKIVFNGINTARGSNINTARGSNNNQDQNSKAEMVKKDI